MFPSVLFGYSCQASLAHPLTNITLVLSRQAYEYLLMESGSDIEGLDPMDVDGARITSIATCN